MVRQRLEQPRPARAPRSKRIRSSSEVRQETDWARRAVKALRDHPGARECGEGVKGRSERLDPQLREPSGIVTERAEKPFLASRCRHLLGAGGREWWVSGALGQGRGPDHARSAGSTTSLDLPGRGGRKDADETGCSKPADKRLKLLGLAVDLIAVDPPCADQLSLVLLERKRCWRHARPRKRARPRRSSRSRRSLEALRI